MYITQLVREFEILKKYEKIIIHLEAEEISELEFKFDDSKFKHLVGFQYTSKGHLRSDFLYKLCSLGQFELEEDSKMKIYNKKKNKFNNFTGNGVNKLIKKIKAFKNINLIICSSDDKNSLVDFDKTLVIGQTEQGSDYILHLEKEETRYHLGLIKISNTTVVPASFFIEEKERKDKFIEGQKTIKIKKISRILKE